MAFWKLWVGCLAVFAAIVLCSPAVRAQEEGHDNHATEQANEDHGSQADHEQGEEHAEGDAGHGVVESHAAYDFRSDLPLWSLVAFVCFALVVWKLNVLNGIANAIFSPVGEHEQREVQLLANAEKLTAEANQILTANRGRWEALDETVNSMLAEAQRDAEHTTGEILHAAEAEATGLHTRANNEIKRVKDQSLNEIFQSLADRVVEAAESDLRGKLGADDQNRLLDATLNQLPRS